MKSSHDRKFKKCLSEKEILRLILKSSTPTLKSALILVKSHPDGKKSELEKSLDLIDLDKKDIYLLKKSPDLDHKKTTKIVKNNLDHKTSLLLPTHP